MDKLGLIFLSLIVFVSFGVVATGAWGQGSTSNGNGSIQERASSDLWSAQSGNNGSGASLTGTGPWDLGGLSQNGTGATAEVGNVGGTAPSSTPTLTPTPTPTDTATDGPTPTPTDTPIGGVTPAPTDTPTDGPSSTPTDTPTEGPSPTPSSTPTDGPSPTPTATCGVTDVDFDLVVDGVLNAEDLLEFLTQLESGTATCDFNCDGVCDSDDLFLIATLWQEILEQ